MSYDGMNPALDCQECRRLEAENAELRRTSHPQDRLNAMKVDEYEALVPRLEEQIRKAKAIANNALYFNDNSDYQTALYQVCEALGMDPEEEAGKDYIEEDE
jgi:hypothetical protein